MRTLGGGTQQTVPQLVCSPVGYLVGDDDAMLGELIESYLEETPKLLQELDDALESQDADRLRRAAHSLKSSSKDFGAGSLAELCLELETQGRAGDLAGAADRVARAQAEFERVRETLTARLREFRSEQRPPEAAP